MKKSGQMKLSFGMIFSIILIILFIAFTIYAIQKTLGINDSVKIGRFKDNLQNGINKIWKGSQGSQTEEYALPLDIKYVCFADYSSSKKGSKQEYYLELKQTYLGFENLFFYPIGSAEGFDSLTIKNINIEKITADENPFCIENKNGKVEMTIKKDFGEVLVYIEK